MTKLAKHNENTHPKKIWQNMQKTYDSQSSTTRLLMGFLLFAWITSSTLTTAFIKSRNFNIFLPFYWSHPSFKRTLPPFWLHLNTADSTRLHQHSGSYGKKTLLWEEQQTYSIMANKERWLRPCVSLEPPSLRCNTHSNISSHIYICAIDDSNVTDPWLTAKGLVKLSPVS